jgi:2-polyprenyl-3-methyl-5-hydroxy-6-metoxy-1,4-benzoquinol methylase
MAERTRTDREKSLDSPEFIWDTTAHPDAHGYLVKPVMSFLTRGRVRTVLDLGCGNGAFSNAIAQHGFDVTGLDHSASGIAIARRTYGSLRFVRHDLAQPLPEHLAGRFDAVVSTEVVEHLLLPRMLLQSARAALQPGGLLILTTPFHGYWKNLALALTGKFDSHWHPLRDYGHVKFFSKSTIVQLLDECGFADIEFATAGRIAAFAKSMIVAGTKRQ